VARAFPPPPGERRFRPGEVLVELPDTTPPADIARLLRAHRLSEARVVDDALVGTSLRVWRVAGARAVEALVRELGAETALTSVQPNYLYELQQAGTSAVAAAPAPKGPAQYSLTKLHVEPGMVGDPIRVAVIDTAIDETHPDLAGAVEARFDAIGGGAPRSFDHGTSIAGAIAARGRLKGVAPNARILSARAFDTEGGKALGDTASIIGALNWAAKQKARVVNMSFAGAPDPDLSKNLASACRDGLTLVGAAGNAGPASPPLYPGADPNVVAVTATDAEDRLYAKANIGPYIAVSAPGVDVILPAPRGAYALETGTSVSAALVTGVAALLLERRPAMTPAEIRKLLMTTATPLGAAGAAALFGAGLVDARRALSAQAPPQTPATN
jgi:subtilisin family serine protease